MILHSEATDIKQLQSVIDQSALIQNLPIAYLAYEATEPYRIIDENAAHEKVALTKREDIIGKPFLEVYPDTSDEFKRSGKSAPIESIKKIVRTKQPDSLGEFNWDVQDENGQMVTKYWRSVQYPVFDGDGNVSAVYQLTEDITEKKLAEKQLALTQYQFDQARVDGLVGTWMWDMKHSVIYGGPNLAGMFGLNPNDAEKGLQLEDFTSGIHPDDKARVSKEIERAVASKSGFESEYRTIDIDGNVRWLIARGRVETDENGQLDRFPGVVIDITERKVSEEMLSENETRLRFMADSMPQLVWVTRPDGYHEYYNQRWYDYTGTKFGTTNGEGWNDLFHPDDQARAWKVWEHSLKTGEPYEIEYRLYHAPSDSYRWVIGRAMPYHDDKGEIIKWYGTCTDIDDQKHDSDRATFLAEVSRVLVSSLDSDEVLKKITKLTVPTIADWCMVDTYSEADGFKQVSIAHSNPKRLKEVIRYRKNVSLDINDDTTVPRVIRSGKAEKLDITDEIIDEYIQDPSTREYLKSLGLCSVMVAPIKDGKNTIGAISFMSAESGRRFDDGDFDMAQEVTSRISLSITNSRLYGNVQSELKHRKELERQLRMEKDRLEASVKERTAQLQLTNQGLIDEVAKRRSIEAELNAHGEELTRSNKELEDFAYVASHDLQEPLRKIQAFGNLLLGEYGDSLGPEGADYLSRMHSAANRMSTLIEDLLAFSRVTRTKHRNQPVDLSIVLSDVVSDLETRMKNTSASVTVGKLPTVMADPTHMRQLFQNLVGNAMKFHRPDVPPKVTVSSKSKGGGFEITVKDNGIGFDEKYLDRIFAVFQRLHERSSYEGTGIGLAVCRKIVEQYGGTITARSVKNQGATFIIWLPFTKERK